MTEIADTLKTLTIRLRKSALAELEAAAQAEGISVEELVERTVIEMLARRAAWRRELEEALAEAEKGEFISSEAIHEWMASWDTENELPPPQPDIIRR